MQAQVNEYAESSHEAKTWQSCAACSHSLVSDTAAAVVESINDKAVPCGVVVHRAEVDVVVVVVKTCDSEVEEVEAVTLTDVAKVALVESVTVETEAGVVSVALGRHRMIVEVVGFQGWLFNAGF